MKALLVVGFLAISAPAFARSEKTEPFEPAEVFPIAVRFLRIDAGVKIVEKDADDGYVLFDLTEDKHTFRGSLELVKTEENGRVSVRIVIKIEDRPEYVEQMYLDKLDVKIRAELGHPKAPPPPKKKPDEEPGPSTGSRRTGTGMGTGADQ
ncbi:MAG TPA: hypothetical protein VL463_10225 [Kofleriaceae bacterium]|nr:hypothetical protein [Kofleriaceae bacterium]